MTVVMAHATWTEPRPIDTPHGVETRYVARGCCGWVQPAPAAKTSHAWRAAKRHRTRAVCSTPSRMVI